MKHKVYEVKLTNGAEGLFIHVPDASVMSFEVNFRAGEYLVSTKKYETPHLMEHLMFGATEIIPKARDFQAEFEKNGAYCNASTGTYDIIYEAECADFEWKRIIGLLQTAISRPLFLEDEFIAEFGNVREELIARSNNHFRHLGLALRQAYGFSSMTDLERVALMHNVKIDDITKHYKNTHTTSNMRFVVAGKLTPERRKQVAAMFEGMQLEKGPGRIELPKEHPKTLKAPLYIENDTISNLYFFVDTFIMKRLNNPEVDAINLLNIIMTETIYSRILGAARERGLIYHMSSGVSQTRSNSNLWFGGQVSPENIEELFGIMTKELWAVVKGHISHDDIEASKQYALGRYQRSGQTVGGTAAGYTGRYFFDGIVDDYYQIPERIEAVTKAQIVDITKEFFSKKLWGLGILGNTDQEFLDKLQGDVQALWQ
jgi:predicted Zn-dependent peptidase